MKRWSVLLLLTLALIFVTSCSTKQEQSASVRAVLTDNQYKKFDRIVKENENFSIEWVDTQGYGGDGAFHLAGKLQCKLNDCSGIDVAIISPEKLEAGSKAWYYKELNTSIINPKSYFCNSAKYGWYQNGKSVWCNATYSYQSNVTNQTIFYDVKAITQIGNPYAFITTVKNATVLWNTTTNTSNIVKTDITGKWNYKNRTTPYGDNIYYLQNVNLFKGKEYEFELILNIDKSKLPLKYSVVVGDMATNKIYYVLDPTIVNARTWSTNDDFTNGTTLTNVSTSAAGITLSLGGTNPQGDFFNETFDRADSATVGNGWTETELGGATVGIVTNRLQNNFGDTNDASASHTFTFPTGTFNVNTSMKVDHITLTSSAYWFRWDAGASFSGGWGFTKEGGGGGLKIHNCTAWVDKGTQVADTYVEWYAVVYPGTRKYDLYIDGVLATANNSFCGSGTLDKISFSTANSGDDNTNNGYANYIYISENTTAPAKTHGEYSDRQSWSPQSGSQITNLSIVADNSSGGIIRFRSNSTNASLDTSDWTKLSNGTQIVSLNLGANNNIFYQYDFNNTGTGKIVSYTMYESNVLFLNGTVYDKNNQTVANASVFVINEVGNTSVATLYTNATGLFWTTIPTASNYTLYAWKNSNISAGGAIKTHVEVK